jgi:hypothetical protein
VEVVVWLGLLALTVLGIGVLTGFGSAVDGSPPPFGPTWRLPRSPADAVIGGTTAAGLAAAAIAVLALVAGRSRAGRDLLALPRWPVLLAGAYVTAVGWTLTLAYAGGHGLAGALGPDRGGVPGDRGAARGQFGDIAAVAADPTAFVRRFTAEAARLSYPARTHPPGATLLLWLLSRAGLRSADALGLAVTAVGCAVVPLVAISARSLCHETAARRLIPVLALAPWSLWTAGCVDGVAAALTAAAVTLGVIGSEPRRRAGWAVAAGLMLGVTTLVSYGTAWLGVAVAATYFARRRPLLNMITGLSLLVPLMLARLAGFVWPDGLRVAQHAEAATRLGGDSPTERWLVRLVVAIAVVLVAGGPIFVRSARRIRMTPGWPFLVGAVPIVAFTVLFGLAGPDTARAWLPAYPWLAVAALAPVPRPPGPGDTTSAGEPPVALVAVGAVTALAVAVFTVSA